MRLIKLIFASSALAARSNGTTTIAATIKGHVSAPIFPPNSIVQSRQITQPMGVVTICTGSNFTGHCGQMVEPTFHCINIIGVSPDVDWTEDWDAQYSPFIFIPTVRSLGPAPGLSCTIYADVGCRTDLGVSSDWVSPGGHSDVFTIPQIENLGHNNGMKFGPLSFVCFIFGPTIA